MGENEIIVLTDTGLFDFGWWVGLGAVSGGFSAVGFGFMLITAWELAVMKYKKRKNALEGK